MRDHSEKILVLLILALSSVTVQSKICLYGVGCEVNSDCISGTFCQLFTGYSQCLEPTTYSDRTIVGATCIALRTGSGSEPKYGCKVNSDCCNPSATCSDNVCSLENTCDFSLVSSNPTVAATTRSPSTIKSISPSAIITSLPSASKTVVPSAASSASPSVQKTSVPSSSTTGSPSSKDSSSPTVKQSIKPTTTTLPTTAASTPTHKLICQYGVGCSADVDCVAGTYCQQLQGYSQCVEKDSYVNRAIAGNTCIATRSGSGTEPKYGCSTDSNCCNPSATCHSDQFCFLSEDCVYAKETTTVVATPTAASTDAPVTVISSTNAPSPTATVSPSVSPSVQPKKLLCQYGVGCGSDSDCIPGATCQQFNGYTQCLETPTYSDRSIVGSTCFATREGSGSEPKYGCTSDSQCCNPSALCASNICMLQTDCVYALDNTIPTTAVISAPPTKSNTVAPTIPKAPLCLYATGCKTDDDCTSGTSCAVVGGSTQCLEMPMYTNRFIVKDTCINVANGQGTEPKYGCSVDQECCNPYANCINNQCVLRETCTFSTESTHTNPTGVLPSNDKLCMYAPGCRTDSDCVAGTTCVTFYGADKTVFTQCLQPVLYSDKPTLKSQYGKSLTCKLTYNTPNAEYGCTSDADCCNPFAKCSASSGFCEVSSTCLGSAPPSNTVIKAGNGNPVTPYASSGSNNLCMYATGCSTDSDCISGNKCYQFNGFSQCLQNPKYTDKVALAKPTCKNTQYTMNAEWGCSTSSDCCNEFATCVDQFCLLLQPCVNSGSFVSSTSPAPTSSPSSPPVAVPTGAPALAMPRLTVAINAATFQVKTVEKRTGTTGTCPPYANTIDVATISLFITVSNVGNAPYVIAPSSLTTNPCDSTLKGLSTMYSITVVDNNDNTKVVVKTRSEWYIRDTVNGIYPMVNASNPLHTTLGISANDHYTTHLWADVSSLNVTSSHTYTATVVLLPLNPILSNTAVSNQIVGSVASKPTRTRKLKVHDHKDRKLHMHSTASKESLYFD